MKAHQNPTINWVQVWGIAIVQGAITISWLVYRLYLPKFLENLGLSTNLALTILIIENFIAIITEPFFGALSDQFERSQLSRLPLIILGIVLTSILTISLPVWVIFGGFASFFPILAIIWAIAMAMFRSPVLALLGFVATTSKLPQAMSILVTVSGVIGSFRTVITPWLLNLGSALCFTIASLILLFSAGYLRFLFPSNPSISSSSSVSLPSFSQLSFTPSLFGMGIGIAVGIRTLIPQINTISDNKTIVVFCLIVLAIMAFPIGMIASKISRRNGLIYGLLGCILCLILFGFPVLTSKILALLILYFAFNLLMNGIIPYAIEIGNDNQSGLTIGKYFAGFSLGMALFDWLLPQDITSMSKLLLGILAFTFSTICFWLGERQG